MNSGLSCVVKDLSSAECQMLMRCIWGTLKLPRALFSANFSVSDTFKFAAGELVVAP